jgi:hypothetical protein
MGSDWVVEAVGDLRCVMAVHSFRQVLRQSWMEMSRPCVHRDVDDLSTMRRRQR